MKIGAGQGFKWKGQKAKTLSVGSAELGSSADILRIFELAQQGVAGNAQCT